MMQDALHILIELEREREMSGGGNNMAVFFDQLSQLQEKHRRQEAQAAKKKARELEEQQ